MNITVHLMCVFYFSHILGLVCPVKKLIDKSDVFLKFASLILACSSLLFELLFRVKEVKFDYKLSLIVEEVRPKKYLT